MRKRPIFGSLKNFGTAWLESKPAARPSTRKSAAPHLRRRLSLVGADAAVAGRSTKTGNWCSSSRRDDASMSAARAEGILASARGLGKSQLLEEFHGFDTLDLIQAKALLGELRARGRGTD
jgi:hypothetical protein